MLRLAKCFPGLFRGPLNESDPGNARLAKYVNLTVKEPVYPNLAAGLSQKPDA